nr:immunoglobulin light chain junction region [Macaca mulatta]
FHQYNNWITF